MSKPTGRSVEQTIDDSDRRQMPQLAPRLAQAVLVAVLGGFFTIALINIFREAPSLGDAVFLVVVMAAIFALQVGYFSRPRQSLEPPVSYVALLAMAALVYLPLLQFGEFWIGFPGYLAGSLLLALPPRAGWPLYGVVVASMTWIEAVLDPTPAFVVYTGVATAITGLMVYGLSLLATMVNELHAARDELAELAVARERLRFARDLHDLLGLSLSAITLKTELASKLIGAQPGRAREELSSILAICRQALVDTRSVASGYRELSLEEEYRSAQAVLTAAEISLTPRSEHGELPIDVGTVLAAVMREGVTNVLRHSEAERCAITVRQANGTVTLDIVNDGVGDQAAKQTASARGNGLRNISERVSAMGGTLTTEVAGDWEFRLHAVVPLPPATDTATNSGRRWRPRSSLRPW